MDQKPTQFVKIIESSLVVQSTASAPAVGSITRPASYPPSFPGSRIQIGSAAEPTKK